MVVRLNERNCTVYLGTKGETARWWHSMLRTLLALFAITFAHHERERRVYVTIYGV